MESEIVGPNEKIQILLAEYTSLRAEITDRVNSGYQVNAIVIAGLAVVVSGGAPWRLEVALGMILGIVILTIAGLIRRDLARLGRRVIFLEIEINHRAGEELLIYESKIGGEVTGFWSGVFDFHKTSKIPKKPS